MSVGRGWAGLWQASSVDRGGWTVAKRGNAALLMWPGVDEMLLTPQVRQALAEVVTLVDDAPIDVMGAPAADLESVEVLIGGWGAAALDAAA
ncbi:MAG: hydroxyacid dehydrogenase, partial [Candidatus Microthrix parvicella]